MIDEKAVKGWLQEVAERIEMNEAEASRLRAEIAKDMRKKLALEALLASDPPKGRPPKPSPPGGAQGSDHPVKRAAIAVLEESGKPLHISDLRHALEQKGVPIPGKGTDANVIVYLSRSDEVCRVGKGLYALRTWGVPEVPPRQRRSKHRGRSRGSRDS